MYHSLMLVDMLDIYNLNRAYPDILCSKLVSLLDKYIPKMLAFMETMNHPMEDYHFLMIPQTE